MNLNEALDVYCEDSQKVVYLIEDQPAVRQDTAGGLVPSAHGTT